MARRSPQHTSGQPVRRWARLRRWASLRRWSLRRWASLRSPRVGAAGLGLQLALGIGAAAWVTGCERRAPGPDECVAFAEAWMRRHRAPTRLDADTAFDDLVRKCLTDPYDRELVTCVVGGHDQERCRVDYVRRVETLRESDPP